MSGDTVHVQWSPVPLCDWRDCEAVATWEIRGQWTIADWLEIYGCGEHLVELHRWLSLKKIDGERCVERSSKWIGDRDS